VDGGSDGGGVPSNNGLCTGPVCHVWGDQLDSTYLNPVLWADYNTLDAIATGSDFYMTSATHHFMGMPVLHSQDLVNWEIVSRVYRSLTIDPRYDTPGLAYQHGSWGPSIRYHEGLFYVYVATPVEGLLMTTATNPAGTWAPMTLIRSVANWQDPCPFWDDVDNAGGDGPNGRQAYLVRGAVRTVSGSGPGILYLHKMSWDGTKVIGDGTDIAEGTTFQGPKLLKRNGYYYIFAPTGAASTGSQVALRSQDIWGASPAYDQRTILESGASNVLGPHVGAWLDLPDGTSWFLHNAALNGWGRVVHLEPAKWGSDGWPTVGIDTDGNGIGEPVAQYSKPNIAGSFPLQVPANSDEFDSTSLGLQWLWNHNPDNNRWSLSARPGWLRLTARQLANLSGQTITTGYGDTIAWNEDDIVFAYNTVVEEAMGQTCSAVTALDTTGMIDGQRAGITLFGGQWGWIGVQKQGSQSIIVVNVNGGRTTGPTLTSNVVYLKAMYGAGSTCSFAYSLDGSTFVTANVTLPGVNRTWGEGIKFGLFTYNLSTGTAGGYADFDYFRYSHDGP
jgi:beta-xylosidase